MKRQINVQKRYQMTRYDGREMTTKTVTAKDLKALKVQSFDHYISPPSGVLGFRNSSGQWVEHKKRWPGLGPVGLDILRALQLNPGDFLTPPELAELTGHQSLRRNEALAARVHAIRDAHEDKIERFVETRTSGGYAIMWPKDRTWLWIDRLPALPQGESQR